MKLYDSGCKIAHLFWVYDQDDDDDEGIRNSCAAGGSLPTAPSTAVAASEVANHVSADDCWTSMESGSTPLGR